MAKLELNLDERLLFSGTANKRQAVGNKGGHLYLTNQRIVFIAHRFNFGSRFDEISLSNVVTSESASMLTASANMIIRLFSGEEVGFIVVRKRKDLWIKSINEALPELRDDKLCDNTKQETADEPIHRAPTQVEKMWAWRTLGFCMYCGGDLSVIKKCKSCGKSNWGIA